MTKVKLKHSLNADSFPKKVEITEGPSMTIPDQSMSVREILDRFSKGLPLSGARTPLYYGEDDDFPDFERMDLSERETYIKGVKEELESLKQKRNAEIDKERREKEDKAFAKRLELEIERRKREEPRPSKYREQEMDFTPAPSAGE